MLDYIDVIELSFAILNSIRVLYKLIFEIPIGLIGNSLKSLFMTRIHTLP